MKLAFRFLALVLVASVLGCEGGSDPQDVTPPEITARDAVIAALEGIIKEGGAGGSEVGAVMEDIGKIQALDPALAKELEDAFMKMMSGTQGFDMRAKAQELLPKVQALKME